MDELNTTGKRVRALREDLGWTQGELAARLRAQGVAGSNSRISRIESDLGQPTAPVLRALALVLGTSADYLMLLSDDAALVEREPVAVNGGPRQ